MYTEIVAVQGVERGLIVSSIVAVIGLVLFTGNIIVSIIASIVLVINIMYMLAFYQLIGWELGAIEAVRLLFTTIHFCRFPSPFLWVSLWIISSTLLMLIVPQMFTLVIH